MKTITLAVVAALTAIAGNPIARAENPYVGHWALTIPGGGAGWLGIEEMDGQLNASVLWGGGSVRPVDSAELKEDQLMDHACPGAEARKESRQENR